MKKNKVALFLVGFFILLSAAFMSYYFYVLRDQKQPLQVLGNEGHSIANFAFTNQEGQTITKKDIAGKICVVEYFFTTCKGICPRMNENMVKVYDAFRGNDHVKILSHTVDPKKDTVAAMKAYSLRFGADPKQWMFLTGDKKELYEMARESYLITATDDTATVDIQSDFIHTQHFVLVDGNGKLRGTYYDGTDPGSVAQLIGDIKLLLKEQEEEGAASGSASSQATATR